jgi:Fe2+ transport system protein B
MVNRAIMRVDIPNQSMPMVFVALIIGALSFAVALQWNSAFVGTIERAKENSPDSISEESMQYISAIVVTVVVLIITTCLSMIIRKVRKNGKNGATSATDGVQISTQNHGETTAWLPQRPAYAVRR